MCVEFTKYQEAGLNFLIYNKNSNSIPLTENLIARIFDRRFGSESEGILIQLENDKEITVQVNQNGKIKHFCHKEYEAAARAMMHLQYVQDKVLVHTPEGDFLVKEKKVHASQPTFSYPGRMILSDKFVQEYA